jgi:uncharacterized membrane protein YgaE (UPF0421/DUF939 family)
MVQTVVVVVLLVADAVLVQLNLAALQTPVSLSIPGTPGYSVTPMLMLVAGGVALVVGWVAGSIDRMVLDRQIHHRDAALRVMSEELLRLKTAANEQQPSWTEIQARLDRLDRDVRLLQDRVQRSSELHAPDTPSGGERPPQHRVPVGG